MAETALAPLDAKKPRAHFTLAISSAALDALEAEMGGREKLVEALLHAPQSDDLDYVIGLIADPREDTRKLATVCAKGAVTVGELMEAFKRGTLAKAMVGAIRRVADATAAIVEDVVARSVVHEVDCGVCFGRGVTHGFDEKGKPCDQSCARCDGTGRVLQDPDFPRQKFVLTELAGLGKAPAGPVVAIDQRTQTTLIGADATPAGYARLMGAADRILYGRAALGAGVRTSTQAQPVVDVPLAPNEAGVYSPASDDGSPDAPR